MTRFVARREDDEVTLTYADHEDEELAEAVVRWLSSLLDEQSSDEPPPQCLK